MFLLEHFSTEVLEMIFNHLNNHREVLKCTEICSRFNNLISMSSRLMDNVKIVWTTAKDAIEVPESRRKYRRVKILGIKGYSLQLQKFFDTFASTLVWLRLENCTFRLFDLQYSLGLVAPRIEEIAFVNTSVIEQQVFRKIEMPRLKYLEFSKPTPEDSDARLFIRIVSTSSLQKLLFGSFGNDLILASREDTMALLNFIEPQKNLKELTLPRTVVNAAIQHWTVHRPLEVKLKSLFLTFPTLKCKCNQTHFTNLWKFLESQRNSLESLLLTSAHFEDEELQDVLSLNLQHLTIVYCPLKWNRNRATRNTSITKLFIAYKFRAVDDASVDAISHLLTSCESVTSIMITFDSYDDRLRPVLAKIATNPKIVDMTVHNIACLNGTTFPAVKNINVMNDDPDDIFKLVRANPQLESILLESELSRDEDFKRQLQDLLPSLVIS